MVARNRFRFRSKEDQDTYDGPTEDQQLEVELETELDMQIEEINEAIEKKLSVAREAGYHLRRISMSRGSNLSFGPRSPADGVPRYELRIPHYERSSMIPPKLDMFSEVPTSKLEIELALRKAEEAKVRDFEPISGSGWKFNGYQVEFDQNVAREMEEDARSKPLTRRWSGQILAT